MSKRNPNAQEEQITKKSEERLYCDECDSYCLEEVMLDYIENPFTGGMEKEKGYICSNCGSIY